MATNQKFGGDWSDKKLGALAGYLEAYGKVLSNTPFKTAYIDAFAEGGSQLDEDKGIYRHGSPLIALGVEPAFDHFFFIDKEADNLTSLEDQIGSEGYSKKSIDYLCGDANEHLQNICDKNWSKHRAVAFLDPFALQIRWDTVKAIAATKSIDMWFLFPAMAVNRMLTRSGEIDEKWQQRLDTTFGAASWKDAFYEKEPPDLFGEEVTTKKDKPFKILSNFVTQRLDTEFAAVHDEPLILKNSSNTPIFLLCFACGNERGSKPAMRIANHIIKSQS